MIIRPAKSSDNKGIAYVRTTSWQSTYKGLLPDDYLRNLSVHTYAKAWRKYERNIDKSLSRLILVAENPSGNIIGFVSGGRSRELENKYDCEIYGLYILDDFQRKGLGTIFVKEMVDYFIYKSFKSMIIWVLENNPACRFYEKLGGEPLETSFKRIGDNNYRIIGYVWKDISKI